MTANLWQELNDFHAIVDTVSAREIEEKPEQVRERYSVYAKLYFPPKLVKEVCSRLIQEIKRGSSVTGYVAADYGYGKTATAVYLWGQCQEEDILAIPPFLFRQLQDILLAVKGWLKYQLRQRHPSLVKEVDEVYAQYVEQSKAEMAKKMAIEMRIDQRKALDIVERYLAHRRDLTTTQDVLVFLEKAVDIGKRAGFKGLILFADESQEFFRMEEVGAQEAIQTLSELVKRIRGLSHTPLGFVLNMPKNTEERIEEQAGDILHRMREKGTALLLDEIYDREFPRHLWSHFLSKTKIAFNPIEERTLEALGQLCKRKDLSNGPRTLISAFKRAIAHYDKHKQPYAPTDLMKDYLDGHIAFDGKEHKIKQTLLRLLDLPVVRHNPDYQLAVMFLGAFPQGVSERLAGDLYKAILDLSERLLWLGEHITQLSEGYALIALQEQAQARPILDEIIRDFRKKWYNTWTDTHKNAKAFEEFYREVLPQIFPRRKPGESLKNFTFSDEGASGDGNWWYMIRGTFEPLAKEFPERLVSLNVAKDETTLNRFSPPLEELDIDFRFLLSSDSPTTQLRTANQDRRVDFILPINRSFGMQFPFELGFLRDIMAPERTSANMLLALSHYMGEWLQNHSDIPQKDRETIMYNCSVLRNHVINLLFPDAKRMDLIEIQGLGGTIGGGGIAFIQSVFEAKCRELYPEYRPLALSKEWRNYVSRYREAISKLSLAERRGQRAYEAAKEEIAKAFRWAVSAFEGSVQILKDMQLLRVEEWAKGRREEAKAKIRIQEHPLEHFILNKLEESKAYRQVLVNNQYRKAPMLNVKELERQARKQGYLAEEVQEAIALLVVRQYVVKEDGDTIRKLVEQLTIDDLKRDLEELRTQVKVLYALMEPSERDEYERLLNKIQEELTLQANEITLYEARMNVSNLKGRIHEFIRRKLSDLTSDIGHSLRDVEQKRNQLPLKELANPVQGTVQFVTHIDDQRINLSKELRNQMGKWDELHNSLHNLSQRVSPSLTAEVLSHLHKEYQSLIQKKKDLERYIQNVQGYLLGLQKWREIVSRLSLLRASMKEGSGEESEKIEDLSEDTMECFANYGQEALLKWEPFYSKLDQIEAQRKEREAQLRQVFQNTKEFYEKELRQMAVNNPVIEVIFDPKDIESSYRLLYKHVLEKVQKWLGERIEQAQKVVDGFEYLIRERGLENLMSDRDKAQSLATQIQQYAHTINMDTIQLRDKFSNFCEEIKKLHESIQDMERDWSHKRMYKEEPSEKEAQMLNILDRTLRTLENIRSHLSKEARSLDEIFDGLKGLYRKGHIEIQIRRRE